MWLGVSSVDAGQIKPVYPQKKWAVKKLAAEIRRASDHDHAIVVHKLNGPIYIWMGCFEISELPSPAWIFAIAS